EFVTGGAGFRDGTTHALLIAVDSGGVDVTVADLEGVGDDALGLVRVDLEHAEAQLRNGLAVVESECGNRHGHPPFVTDRVVGSDIWVRCVCLIRRWFRAVTSL